MTDLTPYLCVLLGLLSALVAGVFQTFSDFVMAGLARARPASAIESMQHINRTVLRSVFLVTLLSLVPVSVAFTITVWLHTQGIGRILVLAATATYVLTVFLVTIAANVPMNEQLKKMHYASEEAALYWQTYVLVWTRWNHVRTIGSALSATLFLLAAMTL